ncbi:MAG: DUF1553 domain-containing protein [Planctomycetes bacterium]|nr:DUF1553 domain-containing protein [Planctomycetota bacterium]
MTPSLPPVVAPLVRAVFAAVLAAQSLPAQDHWSFRPLGRPPLPEPVAGNADFVANEIDRFVAARLAAAGRRPSPTADRETLIRRVTLDLWGLPPTRDEVLAFLHDEEPGAWDRLLDRLFASPRHAEHMARLWLDVARYGDTHGLHLDNYREIWPYRDWVIRAFEANLPYDRFTTEQLAGDLLPGASLDQRIATGFVRSHVTTSEGGSIDEEVYVRNVVDRVNTFGTVFLGLSVNCAQCHDHKFDPITQRDYYGLFAFFNNEDGPPLDGNAKAHDPVVKVEDAEQRAARERLEAERATLETEIGTTLARFEYVEPLPAEDEPRLDWTWIDDELPAPAKDQAFTWVDAPVHAGRRAMRRRGEGLHQHWFTDAPQPLRVGDGDELYVHVWLDPTDPPRQVMVQWHVDGSRWEHRAFWGESVIPWGKEGTASRHAAGPLPPTGRWVRLAVRAADVGLPAGSLVHGIAFTQHGGTVVWDDVGIRSALPQSAQDFVWIDDDVPPGANPRGDGESWRWTGPDAQPAPFSGARALRRSMGKGLNQDFFEGATPPLELARGDRLFAHVWLDPKDPPRSVQLQFNDGSWDHRVRFGDEAHGPKRGNGGDFRAGDLPRTGEWVRLEVALADVGLAPGAKLMGFAFTQVGGTVHWDAAGVRGFALRDDRAAVSHRAWLARAAKDETLPAAVKAALATEPAERDARQARLLLEHWLRHVHPPSRTAIARQTARLATLETERRALDEKVPTTLVMRERAEPRKAYLLRRGEYDKRGDEVSRRVPDWLPPWPADAPLDRLGLARWLLQPDHPLTARVAVNRLWQQFFGIGIVKTAEEFGTKGEAPVDQALLDWLASEFVAQGWDMRRLMRTIVSSATYRQSSSASVEDWQADAENRLYARGPRHRLDAEVLRDQALYLGGLLVEKRFGPPVKPPQPEGIWEAVGYVGSNTVNFTPDRGVEKVHRRSIYTFWKRTAPPPQMTILDAPSREDCRVRRERTNTPLQALLLLNETQYVESARGLAQRLLALEGQDDASRAREALFLATSRRPDPRDVEAIVHLVVSGRARYAASPEAARQLVGVGESAPRQDLDPVELAAWTVAASVILNLDETLTKS